MVDTEKRDKFVNSAEAPSLRRKPHIASVFFLLSLLRLLKKKLLD